MYTVKVSWYDRNMTERLTREEIEAFRDALDRIEDLAWERFRKIRDAKRRVPGGMWDDRCSADSFDNILYGADGIEFEGTDSDGDRLSDGMSYDVLTMTDEELDAAIPVWCDNLRERRERAERDKQECLAEDIEKNERAQLAALQKKYEKGN